jgi:hypothetical protein
MKTLALLIALLFAGVAFSGDLVTWTVRSHMTSSVPVTAYANAFVGEIDEVAVYGSTTATGTVTIVVTDSYSGNALVLCTNAAVSAYTVWTPRVEAAAIDGATALTITNTVTADRFRMRGESLSATVVDSTPTGQLYRVRVKIR